MLDSTVLTYLPVFRYGVSLTPRWPTMN